MGRKCNVCNHKEKAEINRKIIANESSAHAIARQFSLSKDGVLRHRAHIAGDIKTAQMAKFTNFQHLVEEIKKLSAKLDRINRGSQRRENWELWLKREKSVRELAWLATKMAGRIVLDESQKRGGSDSYNVVFCGPDGKPLRIPFAVYAALPGEVFKANGDGALEIEPNAPELGAEEQAVTG